MNKASQGQQTVSPVTLCHNSGEVKLTSATVMPKAAGYLWNDKMLLQMNCRGFAVAQFMQPEPAKYARGPMLEAKTFIQPEHHYFTHHPGRFFYIKDNDSGEIFSLPYEPVKHPQQSFSFSCQTDCFRWQSDCLKLRVELRAHIAAKDVIECWKLTITDLSKHSRRLSVYTYFPVGYMSWMNQSAKYEPTLNGIVCRSITPYQKVDDYFKNQQLKDLTYLISDKTPTAWECRQMAFEGEGGLHAPCSIAQTTLANGESLYDMPTAALQFDITLAPQTSDTLRCLFGPASDHSEIMQLKQQYLADANRFEQSLQDYHQVMDISDKGWQQESDTPTFDHFVNHWLQRQIHYHGDVNRLSTDPQTRNYLQDAMGMVYLAPEKTKQALLNALSQQHRSGAMPDGILLHQEAELKYINQVPHTDHNIWLPVVLSAYLNETADYALLDQQLPFQDKSESLSVKQHINLAMDFLWQARDPRGLHYINQGDWCDPMNMVGYKGRGVSSWLTLATSVAMQMWATILRQCDDPLAADHYQQQGQVCNDAVNQHCWDGNWYARGITDEGHCFGIEADEEGKIFLNPQTWALLANATNNDQKQRLLTAIKGHLDTPYGTQMLAPAYTAMREDVGRVTQKFPGTAENGSVYNHAMAFYIFALYQHGEADEAYRQLRLMVPDVDRAYCQQRGQLPIFIPNYYRGAYQQHPEAAGRSSQLFNTGTCAWIARSIIEGLFGLKGTPDGLVIAPQLPSQLSHIHITRYFRQVLLNIDIIRDSEQTSKQIIVDGVKQADDVIKLTENQSCLHISVIVP